MKAKRLGSRMRCSSGVLKYCSYISRFAITKPGRLQASQRFGGCTTSPTRNSRPTSASKLPASTCIEPLQSAGSESVRPRVIRTTLSPLGGGSASEVCVELWAASGTTVARNAIAGRIVTARIPPQEVDQTRSGAHRYRALLSRWLVRFNDLETLRVDLSQNPQTVRPKPPSRNPGPTGESEEA